MQGEWGAYYSQPVWHFWTEPKHRTLCGQVWLPGAGYERAPDDMTDQKVCKRCSARFERLMRKAGDADA